MERHCRPEEGWRTRSRSGEESPRETPDETDSETAVETSETEQKPPSEAENDLEEVTDRSEDEVHAAVADEESAETPRDETPGGLRGQVPQVGLQGVAEVPPRGETLPTHSPLRLLLSPQDLCLTQDPSKEQAG